MPYNALMWLSGATVHPLTRPDGLRIEKMETVNTESLVSCVNFVADRLGVEYSCVAFWEFLPDREAYNNWTEAPEVVQGALKQYCDTLHPLLFTGATIEYMKRGAHPHTISHEWELAYQERINQHDDYYARGLI